jgi:hypothetical protein
MAHKLQLRALLAGLSFLPPAGGGDCFSSLGMLGSNTAQLGALEVQMVICGFLDVGIVECARAHADHVQPRLVLREHGRPACRAELPVHKVAARGARENRYASGKPFFGQRATHRGSRGDPLTKSL